MISPSLDRSSPISQIACAQFKRLPNQVKKQQELRSSNSTQHTIKMSRDRDANHLVQKERPVGPKQPTQKPNFEQNCIQHFVAEYQKIIKSLDDYLAHYDFVLNNEIRRHDGFFNEMIKVIESEKAQTSTFLHSKVSKLREDINLRKACLQNKITQLQRTPMNTLEKEHKELESQKILEIPLFYVKLQNLDEFKHTVKLFTFQKVFNPEQGYGKIPCQNLIQPSPVELNKRHAHKNTIGEFQTRDVNIDRISTHSSEEVSADSSFHLEEETFHEQTESSRPLLKASKEIRGSLRGFQEHPEPRKVECQETDPLFCDQELTETSRMKSKPARNYKYREEEVIMEESESNENSLVMVN